LVLHTQYSVTTYLCTGLKFWKASIRKIFVIPEEELAGPSSRKRRRVDPLPSELDEALVPLTEKVESLVYDMDTIKGQLKLVFQMTEDTKIPLPLKESHFPCISV